MAHVYTPRSIVILPRLTSVTAHALGTQVVAAAAAQKTRLEQDGQAMPPLIAYSLDRLEAALRELATVLEPTLKAGDGNDTREADATLDQAWGALQAFLVGWSRVPDAYSPDPEGVRQLVALLFPEGLSFLLMDYRSEWSASQSRIDAMMRSPFSETLERLNARGMVDALKQAQDTYGVALGLTRVKPTEAAPEVRAARDRLLDALREYIVKGVAWAEPAVAGSEALSAALLEPLEQWISPAPSTSSSSGTSTSSSGTSTSSSSTSTSSSSMNASSEPTAGAAAPA